MEGGVERQPGDRRAAGRRRDRSSARAGRWRRRTARSATSAAACSAAIHERRSMAAVCRRDGSRSRYRTAAGVPIGPPMSLYDALRAAGLDLQRAHHLDAYLRAVGDDAATGRLRAHARRRPPRRRAPAGHADGRPRGDPQRPRPARLTVRRSALDDLGEIVQRPPRPAPRRAELGQDALDAHPFGEQLAARLEQPLGVVAGERRRRWPGCGAWRRPRAAAPAGSVRRRERSPPASSRGEHSFASRGDVRCRRDGESAGWPRRARHVEESRDSTGQGAGESQVGAT